MSNVKGTEVKPSQALHLDVGQQKNFIKFWNSLGEKPVTTVRFFDRSDYYTLHGEDANLAAKSVFKTDTCVKKMKPGNDVELNYLCLSKGNFEIFLRELLLVKNYRVELFTIKGRDSKTNDWILELKGSPGNLIQFESMLFNNNEMDIGTTIIALNLKQEGQQKKIGVVSVDANERIISIIEFFDDDFFTELEALLVLLGPKECILPDTEGNFGTIKSILDRNNVMPTITKRSEFSLEKSDLIQDLNRLLRFEKGQQETANTLPEISKTVAMSALGAALKYLDLVGDPCNLGHFELKLLNLNRFVHLDAAAVAALNLLPKPGTPLNSPAYKWQSILGVLDRCRTPQGHRLMAQWVKQPLRNEAIIKDRHDIVECFVEGSTARADLYDGLLKKMPDVMVLCKKLMRKKASLQDLYRLYQVVARIPKVISILSNLVNSVIDSVIVSPLKDTCEDLKMFKQMVEKVMDLDGIKRGEFFIKSSFDKNLEELKEAMDNVEEKINNQLRKASEDLNLGSGIKLEYVSHLGYHFRITLKDESVLRKNNKYQTLDAVKGGVRFTTEKLSNLNVDFNESKTAYEEQQKEIVDEAIRVTLGYIGPLTCLNNQIAQLDCLLSFAVAAMSAPIPYTKPYMFSEGNGVLELKQLRHPCLELQEDVTFIPNDCHFKKDQTHMYIITGPNMGGKSTYIRSVGAAVLMAHVGSFVPCEIANISIVDSILGRIGADDNINKGLSTFMVEMIETSQIIRTATENSLVVIDELGRGTSTYEGCGIAWSIAEHLAKTTKCFTLFATHFHEITELAKTVPTVKNSHMVAVADNENFTLLYQVQPGIMDKSFGIHVAKLANFPNHVVELAQQTYDESEDHFTQLKSEADNEATNLFLKALDKFTKIDATSNDEINAMVKEINSTVKKSGSQYFKATFPAHQIPGTSRSMDRENDPQQSRRPGYRSSVPPPVESVPKRLPNSPPAKLGPDKRMKHADDIPGTSTARDQTGGKSNREERDPEKRRDRYAIVKSKPPSCKDKRGTSGETIKLVANFFKLKKDRALNWSNTTSTSIQNVTIRQQESI